MEIRAKQDITDMVVQGLKKFVNGKDVLTKGSTIFQPLNKVQVEVEGERALFHLEINENRYTVALLNEKLFFDDFSEVPALLHWYEMTVKMDILLHALVEVVKHQAEELSHVERNSKEGDAV